MITRRRITDLADVTGIGFELVEFPEGEAQEFCSPHESAVLLMTGQARFTIGGCSYEASRGSLFDEAPFAVHVPKGTQVLVEAASQTECAVFETPNEASFEPRVYADTDNEHRGHGQVGNCALRYVRTIFDGTTSDPATQLVLGEVVNFPGRWSSYPPHHHPQPEIYHYRFTDQRGYGHAELGEEVRKVRHGDTIKIINSVDHAQCSAPGYGMYYIWVIRHLPGSRYTVPEFTEDHHWTMDAGAQFWNPVNEEAVR